MARAGHGPPDLRSKLKGTRVLVAEDEALVSMPVEDEGRDAGPEVSGPAPTVGDALRLFEAEAADVGISAVVSASTSTGIACRRWRTGAALGVPFLFATDCGENHGTGGHGAAPVLRKPFGAETLVAAVASLASAKRHRLAGHGAVRRDRGSGRPPLTSAVQGRC